LARDIKRRTYPEGVGNRAIRDIFRPMRDGVAEGLGIKERNEELHDLFSRSNKKKDWRNTWHAPRRTKMRIRDWQGNLRKENI
jgi:hypothetical protein